MNALELTAQDEMDEPRPSGPPDAGPEPELDAALEAILMVADEPVQAVTFASVLEQPTDVVARRLHELARQYADHGRGFELREAGGGWRFYSAAALSSVVERFVVDGQQARLTQASLETLAVVAYRQPVTRASVSAIRGVNVDGVLRTLLNRGLIEEAGQEPSGAYLYRTTDYFLERLGLRSLDELPDLAPHLPELDALDEL